MLETGVRQEERTVAVGGLEVRCVVGGEDHGDRPPLVLVHGTGGSTASHFGQVFGLLTARRQVVSVDLAEPEDEGAPLELVELTTQVIAAIEQVLPGRRVALCGYSLGAVVAAAVAAERPELVAHLVLVAGWVRTDTQQLLRNRIWRQLRDEGSAATRSYMAFCAFGGAFLAQRTLAELDEPIDAIALSHFVDRQMDLNRRVDISALVPRIEAPTLVIGCTHDQMVPARHAKALFGAIRDARYTELASGHAVVFERPAELVHHIDVFDADPGLHPAGTIIPASRP